MAYENILLQFEAGVAVVALNRPQALNALNRQTMAELRRFFSKDFEELNGLRGVILTGSGEKSFVAGADISEFLKLSAAEGEAMAKRGQDLFFLIEKFHVPVVAAINGFALGGGCELAMACHLRIASEKARFGQPEVNLGLIPGYGGTQRLIQYVGKTKALELMLTGDMIGAEEALRLGLVNHVVPHGQEVSKAKELIEKIASKAPIAVTKVLEAVNAYFDLGGLKGFAREVSAFGECCSTDDFREGAAAFLEKRKADFKGR